MRGIVYLSVATLLLLVGGSNVSVVPFQYPSTLFVTLHKDFSADGIFHGVALLRFLKGGAPKGLGMYFEYICNISMVNTGNYLSGKFKMMIIPQRPNMTVVDISNFMSNMSLMDFIDLFKVFYSPRRAGFSDIEAHIENYGSTGFVVVTGNIKVDVKEISEFYGNFSGFVEREDVIVEYTFFYKSNQLTSSDKLEVSINPLLEVMPDNILMTIVLNVSNVPFILNSVEPSPYLRYGDTVVWLYNYLQKTPEYKVTFRKPGGNILYLIPPISVVILGVAFYLYSSRERIIRKLRRPLKKRRRSVK